MLPTEATLSQRLMSPNGEINQYIKVTYLSTLNAVNFPEPDRTKFLQQLNESTSRMEAFVNRQLQARFNLISQESRAELGAAQVAAATLPSSSSSSSSAQVGSTRATAADPVEGRPAKRVRRSEQQAELSEDEIKENREPSEEGSPLLVMAEGYDFDFAAGDDLDFTPFR